MAGRLAGSGTSWLLRHLYRKPHGMVHGDCLLQRSGDLLPTQTSPGGKLKDKSVHPNWMYAFERVKELACSLAPSDEGAGSREERAAD